MNTYRILNVIYHILVIPIWISNLLCVIYLGWLSAYGLNLFVSIFLPIVYTIFWIVMYKRYKQPTVWKTIWFIIKNK